MKFGMLLCYGNPSGRLQRFFEILNFRRFLPFFLENIVFSPILNDCRSPVKFSMLLHYGNTYIYFQQFFEILNFHWFSAFFWKKHNFFGTAYHLHYQSYPKEIWYAASLWQYLATSTTIFLKFYVFLNFCCFPWKHTFFRAALHLNWS